MMVKVLMRVCKELFQGFTGECLFIGRCVWEDEGIGYGRLNQFFSA